MKNISCALILGGYVNGYCIVRELFEKGIRNIYLFDYKRGLATYSNKIRKYSIFEKNPESLLFEIEKLHNSYNYMVIYPTDDLQIDLLNTIYDKINHYCFIPFNPKNITENLDKYEQYKCCEKIGVPYPKTEKIDSINKIYNIDNLLFPVLIKPTTRVDIKTKMFRSLEIKTRNDFKEKVTFLKDTVSKGIPLIASEIIPGEGSNIYAYIGYRNHKGEILNEWIGKKLSQFPDDFGVFSSASNQAPEIIREQGRKLLYGMNLIGINEPEFKYDQRDGKYKLMEINLRSMMWHRTGNISGVNLQHTQYLDALGSESPQQKQILNKTLHFVYFKHEIINLLRRKGYWGTFKHNLWGEAKTNYAIFDKTDIKPFIIDSAHAFRAVAGICLRHLKIQ